MIIENKKSVVAVLAEYGMYVFFVLFPFFIFNNFLYQGSSSRFLLLTLLTSVLGIFLGGYLFTQKNKLTVFLSPILGVAALYLVYLFVSALLGVDFNASFWSRIERTSGLFYLSHLALFVLFLVHIFSEEKSRWRLIRIVIFTSALYSLCSLLGPQGLRVAFLSNPYDGFLFGNSSFAAMYLLGAFLLSIYSLWGRGKNAIRWYEYVLPVAIVANPFFFNMKTSYASVSSIFGIAKASSIAFFLSLGVLLMIFLISKIKSVQWKKVTGYAFAGFAILTLVWMMSSLISPTGIVRKFYENQSTLARPLVWEIAKGAIQERPLTGWGVENFSPAFQENFDNRLLTEPYGNEPWFDRAHNIIIDQTVDTGYVGVILYFIVYLVLFVSLIYVLYQAKDKEDKVLAAVLLTYFFAHIIELQTAFDTTISLVMVSVMLALSCVVFQKTYMEKGKKHAVSLVGVWKYGVGVLILGYSLWSLLFGVVPFWKMQNINGEVRTVGVSEKRIPLYDRLFDTRIDPAGILWRTSNDFQRGISQRPEILENPEKAAHLLEELDVITAGYETYLSEHPHHFRAHLNLADLYIYHMLFGVDKLDDANRVLDDALALDLPYPQPYWMKAVAALYRRDFKNARLFVQKAKEISPESVETKRLEHYIEDSIKTFPEIELYFFNQI